MKKQVNKNHYNFLEYNNLQRWNSYYYQIFEILSLQPKSVLEIGAGSNILKKFLLENKIKYYSCDIAKDLNPDFLQSVDEMNINKKFDLVCAFQVLEHLPFNKFEKSLINLKNHSNKYIIISLPDCRPNFHIKIKIPLLKEIKLYLKLPFFKKIKFNGEHYWEFGGKYTKPNRILKIIKNHFKIIKKYHVPENPYHLMFVLKKI